MVLNPASCARTQHFLNLPLSSIHVVVKQSVMKQVIAKYLTENVCVIVCMGGGGGEGRGGRGCSYMYKQVMFTYHKF